MARGHSRSARPTFLIVTNGEVTERQYFEYFRRFVPSLRIKTIKGASPKQVVEKANKFSREAKREGAQYTKVWPFSIKITTEKKSKTCGNRGSRAC